MCYNTLSGVPIWHLSDLDIMPSQDPLTDYISTGEASKKYGLSQDYLSHLAVKQVITGRKMARNWLVFVPSLESYLAYRPKPGIKLGQKLGPRRKVVAV